jgi:hypothetical protein
MIRIRQKDSKQSSRQPQAAPFYKIPKDGVNDYSSHEDQAKT